MCDSRRPTEGADSATGIDRERILERVEVYRPPVRVPEWVRRAQEQRLVTKDMSNGGGR